MSISEEVVTTLMNGGIYELFMIFSMYVVFEIMLGIGKKKKKIFFTVFFLTMFIFNMITIYQKYYGENAKRAMFVIGVLSIASSVIHVFTLKILTERDYLRIFLVYVIAEILGTIVVFNIYGGMASLVGKNMNTLVSPNLSYKELFALIGALVLMTVSIFIERVLLRKYLSGFYKKQIRWKGVFWGIVLVFNVSGLIVTGTQEGDFLFIITDIIMILIAVLIFYEVSWWVRMRREKQIKKENQILSIENAVMKEYYDTLDYQLERTRKFRHDIEKHMTVLKEMVLSHESGKDLMHYAAQIEEQYNYLQTIDYCGNPVVNAILVNKKHQCDEHNIVIEIEIGQFKVGEIKEIDLIAVISNLLDNAIEECISNKENKVKKIVFRCGNKASNLFLSVSNTTKKERHDCNTIKSKTWKKDTYAHGVGLSIVQEIVEKYDGMFQMEIEKGMCEVTVVMAIA